MKKNLKNLFTSRDSVKGYVDSSLFYDESMGAFIINDEKIAKDVLKSKSFTAFRKQDQIESLSTSNENKRVMTECYKDRKSTRLNSSHVSISYAVYCLK